MSIIIGYLVIKIHCLFIELDASVLEAFFSMVRYLPCRRIVILFHDRRWNIHLKVNSCSITVSCLLRNHLITFAYAAPLNLLIVAIYKNQAWHRND